MAKTEAMNRVVKALSAIDKGKRSNPNAGENRRWLKSLLKACEDVQVYNAVADLLLDVHAYIVVASKPKRAKRRKAGR